MKMAKYSPERGHINENAEGSRSHVNESVYKILQC